MSERRPYVAANWKMSKTVAEAEAFLDDFLPGAPGEDGPEVVICPSFLALRRAVERCTGTAVRIAAQNMHEEESGAFTGEVSAPMLLEAGVEAVVLGHSERRQLFGESDAALARKLPAALAAGLEPILCVGETEEARDAEQTEGVLERQIEADLAAVEGAEMSRLVVAYEPIWAIGTGRTATPEQAQEAIAFIRDMLAGPRRRRRSGADPLRRLGEAGQRGRADGPGRHRRCPGRRGLARSGGLRRDRRGGRMNGPSQLPVPSLALVVLDGWGLAPAGPGNAISLAETPNFDRLWSEYPHTQLSAQGRDVGLPDGQMGNSEVGHLNLGAGAVVKQDLTRIDDAIADGSFFENEPLRAACERARSSPGRRLHLLGLVSDGGVHSGWEHLEASIELATQEGVPEVVFHAFTDGRDTLPTAGRGYLAELERWLRQAGRIGTVAGRFYAMDRDTRWERIKLAYDAIVHGEGLAAPSADAAIAEAYERGETDEFVKPTVIGDYRGMAEGDVAFFVNFRPDRAREMTMALADPGFDGFSRSGGPLVDLTTMTSYRKGWDYPVAFPEERPKATIAEVVSEARGEAAPRRRDREVRPRHLLLQRRPRAGVGGRGAGPGAVPPRRRDLRPEARDERPRGGRRLRRRLERGRIPLRDHQLRQLRHGRPHRRHPGGGGGGGHGGLLPGEVVDAVHAGGGACIVTADHGNSDHMLEPDGSPNTAHSLNPVPLIVTAAGVSLRDGGILADVAPTALELLGMPQPAEMTGRSLLTAERRPVRCRRCAAIRSDCGSGSAPATAMPGPG